MRPVTVMLIGGPTALIEVDGFRLLTDPTFDPPGEYRLRHATLRKTSSPALTAREVGRLDAVLLSHDQHADNLDNAGRTFVDAAARVFTTKAGAERLGGRAEGLAPWETRELAGPHGRVLTVVATPARHGPAGIEPLAGDVIGFVLAFNDGHARPIYVTGDTVWYDGVAEVARRFPADTVLLFAGAARTRGPFHLTMDTNDAIDTYKNLRMTNAISIRLQGYDPRSTHLRSRRPATADIGYRDGAGCDLGDPAHSPSP